MTLNFKDFYDKEYFRSGTKSAYKNYNEGFNYYKHRLRDYLRALHLIINYHPKKVLDIGCAFGFLVASLRSFGVDAYGVDISEYAVNNSSLKVRPHLHALDITKGLPFEDNYFDLIVSYDVLEHISSEKIPVVLKEIKRVSSKNLFFEIYIERLIANFFKVEDLSHVSVFKKNHWCKIFEGNGFKFNNKFLIPNGFHLVTGVFNLKPSA